MNQKVENLSFESALGELEDIVKRLESGKSPLEEAITAYERGMVLRDHCQKKLEEARMKVERISLSPDGAQVSPFPTQE